MPVVRVRLLVAISCAVTAGGAGRVAAQPRGAGNAEVRAEAQIEASGFVGVDWFGARSSLGDSWAPEQVPGTAALVGVRASWLALPALPDDLQLALETELAFAPAFTGHGEGRATYFAPVLEWRGQAALRLARWQALVPHLVIGAGADSVASRSPFMADDTDPIAYWGLGISSPTEHGMQFRLDVQQGVMPARDGGAQITMRFVFGLGVALGSAARTPPREPAQPPEAIAVAAAGPPVARDSDGDGVLDRNDTCPDQPGIAPDGCPPPDPDGDGLAGDSDRCPDQPEDVDGWQDGDGCPDPDNDGDGIADARDACPDQPEAFNGWQDGDGCPDEVPAEVRDALATTVRFEPGRARVTEQATATLRAIFAVLDRHPEVRIAVIGHAERPGAEDLARRRADAVKWRLVDLGIAEDQVVARLGAVTGPPPLTFQLITAPPPLPSPPPERPPPPSESPPPSEPSPPPSESPPSLPPELSLPEPSLPSPLPPESPEEQRAPGRASEEPPPR